MARKTPSKEDKELLRAVKDGQTSRVAELLQQGADPNARSGKKTALSLVPHRKDEITCLLIEAGADDPALKTRLVWAVDSARPSVVKRLIDLGADLNVRTPMGTPITVAAGKGCLESMRMLLEAGCDANAGNSLTTPLCEAIEKGHQQAVQLLLEYGAAPDHRPSPYHLTPLLLAVQLESVASVSALLKAGAEVGLCADVTLGNLLEGNIEKLNQVSPLHLAVHLNNLELAELLLEAGADPGNNDGAGRSSFELARQLERTAMLSRLKKSSHTEPEKEPGQALLEACERGDLARVQELLDQGVDIECRDRRARTLESTPLLLAARQNHTQVCLHLLQAGADAKATDGGDKIPSMLLGELDDFKAIAEMGFRSNRSALHWALDNGNLEAALALIRAGAEVEHKDHLGSTPMMLAATLDAPEVLEALQQAGAKIDKAGGQRTTPLMRACEKGCSQAASWLLDNKAKPNRKNSHKETPLLLACQRCDADLIKLLLKAGADPESCDEFGFAALGAVAGATREVPYVEGETTACLSVSYRDDGVFTQAPYPDEQVLASLEALLEAGARVNPEQGEPALVRAAQTNCLAAIRKLLEVGADPLACGKHGDDALSTAELFNHQEAIALLKAAAGSRKRKKKKKPETFEPKARMLEVPDFSKELKKKKFQQAVSRLGEYCGAEPTFDTSCARCHVDTLKYETLQLEPLQDEFLKEGYFLYSSGRGAPDDLTLIPSPRWQDALALEQTNGINYDIGTGDIVEWLEGLQETHPFRLRQVSYDLAAGSFQGAVKKPKALAERMYKICPDTVDQGAGTLEELAEDLKRHRSFFLWWD